MWDRFGKVDLFLFTSNPIVNKRGLAVMGRGIAKQVADRYPGVRRDFGTMLQEGIKYSCDQIGIYDDQAIGYFMVKLHWKDAALLDVIRSSTASLNEWLVGHFPPASVALNFPGIGNGRLRREDVLSIIEKLPDNVEVWEYE